MDVSPSRNDSTPPPQELQKTSLSPSSTVQQSKKKSSKRLTSCSVLSCLKNSRRNPDLCFPRFPNDFQRCWKWVKAVGDPDLVHVPIEKLSTLRRVCSEHFAACDFSVSSGSKGMSSLRPSAIPFIFNPYVEPLSDEIMKGFVGYASQQSLKKRTPNALVLVPPFTSQSSSEKLSCDEKEKPAKSLENKLNAFDIGESILSSSKELPLHQQNTPAILVGDSCFTPAEVPGTTQDQFSDLKFVQKSKESSGPRSSLCESPKHLHPTMPHDFLRGSPTPINHREETEETFTSYPLQVYPIRIQPGKEITSFLKSFVTTNRIKAALILTCVGSVSSVDLRCATSKDGKHAVLEVRENLEICSLVGTVCQDGLHVHGTFGNSEGQTLSGHVMGNMIVQTTAEIMLGQAHGVQFSRVFDSNTGFRELVVEKVI